MGAGQGRADAQGLPHLSGASLRKEVQRLKREKDEAEARLKEMQQLERRRGSPDQVPGSTLPTLLTTMLAAESAPASSSKSPIAAIAAKARLLRGQTADSTPGHVAGDTFAESLNGVLEHMWPAISAYVTRVLKEEVEPAVQAALPNAFRGLHFDGDRCTLGHRPPELLRVTSTKERQDTAEGPIENLVLRCRVDWKADCDICLVTPLGVSIGIKNLYVRGNLLVEMVNLITRPPMFEGLRMFFLNPPELDLDFQGAGGGLLNLGVIKAKILGAIEEQLAHSLVVPNRVGMKLDLDADIFRITSPPSEGILKVHVCGAQGLLPMDIICCGQGTSDPYVQVRCGAHVFRSPTKSRTLSPRFSYECLIPISSLHQRVKLTLYDEDLMSQDDFLGKLKLPVSVLATYDQEVTHNLQGEDGLAEGRGRVTLKSEWRPLAMHDGAADLRGPGVLFTGVYGASGVPDYGEGALYYVVMSCTALLPGASSGPQETSRLEKSHAPSDTWETEAKSVAMRSKMSVLEKYSVSEEDLAAVLEVDPARLRQTMARKSTGAVDELAASSAVRVEWEQGYEFLVERLGDATVTFELRCQSDGSSGSRLIGTGRWSASQSGHRALATVAFPGTTAALHLRIRLLHLREPTTQVRLSEIPQLVQPLRLGSGESC
mmetsp:Transcript_17244/g.51677  ORF Transcript_17244/g.51677 Transcript_17244/m.51677 type:complete len:659 (-) Transcript_17244:273-2249(-)